MTLQSPIAALLLSALALPAPAQQLVYVHKATRAETRAASLAASGVQSIGGDWQLIGPFDNGGGGIDAEFPPEREIDLAARYPGKTGEIGWQAVQLAAGTVHDLKRFGISDNCTCYLYKRIESPVATRQRLSLGSDDGIAVWLGGKRLLANNTVRGASPDQDFVTLPLQPGGNELLIEIANAAGEWSFYYQPALPAALVARLDDRLDEDFPPSGETGYYRITTLPLPDDELLEGGGLAFRPDGKLYLATRRGDVWLIDNPLAENPDEITMRPYLRGLHEILGLSLVGENDLYLVQRPEITLVRDADGDGEADEFTTVCDRFGISGDYHEYLFGPARDAAGNFFVTLNAGFAGGHQSKVPYRGFCLKVTPQGEMIPWAYGLRSPNGVGVSPDGRVYYCDNQGEWVAACKMHELRQGDFCGHMASVRWWPGKTDRDRPEMTPPAIWFPYGLSQSTSEMTWDATGGKFGPFAGQCFVGELTSSLLMRVDLEEVGGRMQGAVFAFRRDFMSGVNRLAFAPDGSLFVAQTNRGWGSRGGAPHGLQRVSWRGRVPLEIHSLRITPAGWDVRFTRPLNRQQAAAAATYFVESYTYHHWETYGSPEIDRRQHAVSSVRVSDDGQTVSLSVPGRGPRRVYHLQVRELIGAAGEELLHPDGWYTANALP